MIRAKGGRRQPRYFYLKDSASNRLCMLLDKSSSPTTTNFASRFKKMSDEIEMEIFSIQMMMMLM